MGIRKMIGFIVAIMRNTKYAMVGMESEEKMNETVLDEEALQRMAFSVDYKMAIPLAPSQGLYLKQVRFDEYNKKCIKCEHPWKQLLFDDCEESVNEFIMQKILPSITKHEVNKDEPSKGNQFAFWLYTLENDFKYHTIKITAELLQKLKEQKIKSVSVGNTHQPIDRFYDRIIQRAKDKNVNNKSIQIVDALMNEIDSTMSVPPIVDVQRNEQTNSSELNTLITNVGAIIQEK